MDHPERSTVFTVIAVGKKRAILKQYIAHVPSGPHNIIGVTTPEELAHALATGKAVGVILGGGLDDDTRSAYRSQINRNSPGLAVVDHVGGTDGFVSQLLALIPLDP